MCGNRMVNGQLYNFIAILFRENCAMVLVSFWKFSVLLMLCMLILKIPHGQNIFLKVTTHFIVYLGQ